MTIGSQIYTGMVIGCLSQLDKFVAPASQYLCPNRLWNRSNGFSHKFTR